MKNEQRVLVVKDNEGTLIPMAGIWIDNEAGNISKELYLKKNKEDTVVTACLVEVHLGTDKVI